MTYLAKCIPLVSFGFALVAVNRPAQDYNSLPDDPGQALIAKPASHEISDPGNAFLARAATHRLFPDDPGQAFLAKAASHDLPDDPGQTEKPPVDFTTGVPQR